MVGMLSFLSSELISLFLFPYGTAIFHPLLHVVVFVPVLSTIIYQFFGWIILTLHTDNLIFPHGI